MTYIDRLLNISCNGTRIKISFAVIIKSSHVEVSKEKI